MSTTSSFSFLRNIEILFPWSWSSLLHPIVDIHIFLHLLIDCFQWYFWFEFQTHLFHFLARHFGGARVFVSEK